MSYFDGTSNSLYSEFIHKSRYARWLPEKGRRETWEETVDRYIEFFCEKHPKLAEEIRQTRDDILQLRVMPSMRCLMTAGKALERDNVAGYNCSYVAVDSPRVFDEVLYVLMCGVGVGFSVERQFVNKLPEVAEEFHETDTTIVVRDSKIGWAAAFRELVSLLYMGQIPKWDVSRIRPAGSRLKTFGGRASGPEPLEDLFRFSIQMFRKAAGRRLSSIECHDLVCKVAEIVVVGGVRRCLPKGSPVQTTAGIKRIEEVTTDDVVVTGGKNGKVLAVVDSGEQGLIRIKHRFGELVCTPSHRVAVFNSIMKYEFKLASEIQLGDRLVWDSVGFDGEDLQLPLMPEDLHFNASEFRIPSLDTEVAWLIGLIHGDGYISEKGIEIAGNMKEITILEKAKSVFESRFGLTGYCGSDGRSGCGARLRINSSALARWFALYIKQSNSSLVVPDCIFRGTREVRFAYLSGLLDADGRVRKDGVIEQCTTVYEAFANQLVTLLSGLGIGACVRFTSAERRREAGELARDYYSIYVIGNTNRRSYYENCKSLSFKVSNREINFAGMVDFSFPIRWADTNQGYSPKGNINVSAMRYDLPLLPSRVMGIEDAGRSKTYDIEVEDLHQFTSGGVVVHNSALISLSNLSDDRMRVAKSGQWWLENSQRQLSNNSACYTEKPEFEIFLKEWKSLYESKSGERGIFSRVAARKQVESIGRRDPDYEWGCNPCCVSPDTYIMTVEGPRKIKDLEGKPFQAVVNGKVFDAPHGSWRSGVGDVYRLSTKEGYSVDLTREHLVLTKNRGWVPAESLEVGEEIVLHNHKEVRPWGGKGTYGDGYLLGMLVGDGNFIKAKSGASGEIKVWKSDIGSEAMRSAAFSYANKQSHRSDWGGWSDRGDYERLVLARGFAQEFGIDWKDKYNLSVLEETSYDCQRAFLRGLFDSDGHVEGTQQKGFSVRLGSASTDLLRGVQRMLSRLGIKSSIHGLHQERKSLLPDGKGGQALFDCKAVYRLVISAESVSRYKDLVGFTHSVKAEKLSDMVASTNFYRSKWRARVSSLEYLGRGEVWDAEVSCVNAFDANGLYIHNSEILLRPAQFCNLSEVVVRSTDTLQDLKDKVRVAAILGTLQATLTDFRYLRKVWKRNTEEERLLGVSLTGIMDHKTLSDYSNRVLPGWLSELRDVAIEANKEWAAKLGIAPSTAITAVKPSGTVSQLVDSSSGIHPRYSRYYIRRVRADKKDPLAMLMLDQGFPVEEDVLNPNVYVFSFPVEAPKHARVACSVGAMDQLRLWDIYQTHWCEHKPSQTVYYVDDDFLEVGNWVWRNFDKISGISFLPHSDHVYAQAPYEEIGEETYQTLLKDMPTRINWKNLIDYETEDNTVGSQTYACSGDVCEVVDLTS